MTIREFKSLPNEIYKQLFIRLDANKSNRGSRISLIPVSKLFPCLTEITLINLNINQITIESKQYVDAVMEYINMLEENAEMGLEKIVFQSKKQQDNKINATLKKLETRYSNKFSQLKWKIEYRLQDTHNLTFINYNYNKTQSLTLNINGMKELKNCNTQQMIYIVNDICLNKSEKLKDKRELFTSWFLQHNVNGSKFMTIERKRFVEAMIAHCNNKKMNELSIILFKFLHDYDFNRTSIGNVQQQTNDENMFDID
eukprot:497917_1